MKIRRAIQYIWAVPHPLVLLDGGGVSCESGYGNAY